MMTLIRSLSAYREFDYDGWLIARAEWELREDIQEETYTANQVACLRHRTGYSVLCARNLCDKDVGVEQLTVTLMRADGYGGDQRGRHVPDFPENGFRDCPHLLFTSQEIEEYLERSGDSNSIHRGAHPVVPGLCIMERLTREREIWDSRCRRWGGRRKIVMRFFAPVYAGEEIALLWDEGRSRGKSLQSREEIIMGVAGTTSHFSWHSPAALKVTCKDF